MLWETLTVSVNMIILMLYDPEVLFTVKDVPNGNIILDSPTNIFKKTHNNFIHNSPNNSSSTLEIVQIFINSRMTKAME